MTSTLSRRRLLAASAAVAGWSATGFAGLPAWASAAIRKPDSVPDPSRPPGTPDANIPIDTVIVVMMENHSFDNYLGLLPHRGQSKADGFRIDSKGRPTATNPVDPRNASKGFIRAFHMPSVCQMEHEPNQAWVPTHEAIANGRMDGFIQASGDVAMGYWTDADLPFYYSLANTFTVANRWFCSAPAQTYPNRRFLQAATAYGLVSSTLPSPTEAGPPNGTIFDRCNSYDVSWTNYFTDIPATAVVPATTRNNPTHYAPIAQFYVDAAAGRLPNVCYVDPDFGGADVAGGLVPDGTVPTGVRAQGQDEENPQNIDYGQQFVSQVVNAVTSSPQWKSTLLLWVYDEHGGYYDHVPPPKTLAPDNIPPAVPANQLYDGYRQLGVRVPAVVVSPWVRPHSVNNVVHDHTSFMAFIERKWNLPACTYRDANAQDMLSFLDFSTPPRLLTVPALEPAPNPLLAACDTDDPNAPVQHAGSGSGNGGAGSGGGNGNGNTAAGAGNQLPATGGLPAALPAAATLAAGLAALHARRRRPTSAEQS